MDMAYYRYLTSREDDRVAKEKELLERSIDLNEPLLLEVDRVQRLRRRAKVRQEDCLPWDELDNISSEDEKRVRKALRRDRKRQATQVAGTKAQTAFLTRLQNQQYHQR